MKYALAGPGDPAPDLTQQASGGGLFATDAAAGRYLVLLFFASSQDPVGRAAIEAVASWRGAFTQPLTFLGVSIDPRDAAPGRLAEAWPHVRFLFDVDGKISRAYGVNPIEPAPGEVPVRRRWVVVDPSFRIHRVIPFTGDGRDRELVFDCLLHLPPPEQRAGLSIQAPVLVLPDVFEQSLCAELVDAYERQGGVDSTVQRDDGGMSVNQVDASAKRRKDVTLRDRELTLRLRRAMERRVLPEILKAYQFKASHIERYLVGCYAAEDQAHFGAHRDNTHKAVAHRKFAVSVNLNDGFEGGEVVFPEYGPRGFRTAAGGALVFSCALLHAVTPVTRGRRYAFLPFIYDEDGARLRSENAGVLRPGPPVYVGG